MPDVRPTVKARLSALASAVGLVALLAVVLWAVHGTSAKPTGGQAGGSASGVTIGAPTTGASSATATSPTTSTSPNPPSAGSPGPANGLAALVASVGCPAPTLPARASGTQLASFHPVAALQCQTVEMRTASGATPVQVRKVATDLTGLLAALRQPDAPPSRGLCPDIAWAGPQLVLIDSAGHTLVPSYPRDGCGQPQHAVLQALSSMNWTVVARHPMHG